MGKVVTITMNKGGCGKSTTAVNLAAGLRADGYDVLIIDADGQANTTDMLRVSPTGGNTYTALKDSKCEYVEPKRVLCSDNGAGVLDVLPSCRDLSAVEVGLSQEPDRLTRLGHLIDQYKSRYDYIVVDTPPAQGIISISALYACDFAIVPALPHYLHVSGMGATLSTIKIIEDNRGAKIPHRVLFNMYDRRKSLHRLTVERLEENKIPTFSTKIRENVTLAEAPVVGVDVFRYNPNSKGAEDYAQLCKEFVGLCKVKHTNHRYNG